MKKFKRYVNQWCIGYNKDFSKVHWREVVEFDDETTETQYQTTENLENNYRHLGKPSKYPPIIDRPITQEEKNE